MVIRPKPPHEEGFTLVEVLMALLILAIVTLGLAGMFSHAMVVNASGYEYARLASQARFVLEELRARDFDDDTLNATGGTDWAPQNLVYSNRNFTATYSITDYTIANWADLGSWPVAAAGDENVKRITVRVQSAGQNLFGRHQLVVSALKIAGD